MNKEGAMGEKLEIVRSSRTFCRVSPFFPTLEAARACRGTERTVSVQIGEVTEEIAVMGVPLTVREEEILYALFALAKQPGVGRASRDGEGRPVVEVRISARRFLAFLGEGTGGLNVRRLKVALKMLRNINVTVSRRGADGVCRWSVENLLAKLKGVERGDRCGLHIEIDPEVARALLGGEARIPWRLWRALESGYARALYRAALSHRPEGWWFDWDQIRAALGGLQDPAWRLKERINRAMAELKKHRLVTPDSGWREGGRLWLKLTAHGRGEKEEVVQMPEDKPKTELEKKIEASLAYMRRPPARVIYVTPQNNK